MSPQFRAAILASHTITKPQSYKDACIQPQWKQAMNSELKAPEANNTWTLTCLPQRCHTIGNKWVYKVKYKPNGDIERYKARLVAKPILVQSLPYLVWSPISNSAKMKGTFYQIQRLITT
ncbi:uncharacterized mitochondrial protein AtMg00820-like [Humulus lupulus]|uniref:uncharacterized mitochondrial protein AtMg00820-like n=1 Tax=Humulus lupulus TaxID=3486 RepID=UPI002B409559|nr:uncharacterized mitochondrial protein AtMg00820-like [Humulus lupulus]